MRWRPDARYLGLAATRTVLRPDVSWLLASTGTRRRIKAAATRAVDRVEELTPLLPVDYGRSPLWAVLGCFDERRRTGPHEPPRPLDEPLPPPARAQPRGLASLGRGGPGPVA